MGGEIFRFKRFTIRQHGCAMKVGTDGTLLGAWCRIEPDDRLALDIGTGTGLIAIMLAQRSAAQCLIHAVECDAVSVGRAEENVSQSPWPGRISVIHDTIQNYAARPELHGRFDNIVSNPPYFSESLLPPDSRRSAARHTVGLSHPDLLRCADILMAPEGRFSVVIPETETDGIILAAARLGLYPSRQTSVRTTPEGIVKRRLLEFSRAAQECLCQELTIETEQRGMFSEAYRQLTGDFYLKF